MSGEMAGAADIVTGAVVAHAIEGNAGTPAESAQGACLNCGAMLDGAYCGQKAQVHRTLPAFGHDILHSVLHFDGKIWRTLPMLLWNPGHLTRRYIHGQRARFVSPLALFLFTVFLTFAAFSAFGPALSSIDPEMSKAATEELQASKAEKRAEIERLEAEQARAKAQGATTERLDEQLKSARTDLQFLDGTSQMIGKDGKSKLELNLGSEALNEMAEHASQNPQLLFYKIQSNGYKFSWALIPISVPFVWLLFFWRRRFKLFDHAVFVTYSLCFMMLLGLASALLIRFSATETIGGLLLAFAPPLHIYRQLKQAYELGRFGAAWRTFALLLFALTALTLFLTLIVTLGVL